MAAKIFGFVIGSGLSSSFIVPSDWNNSNNKIEIIGEGATVQTGTGTGGGGGGAYTSISNFSLTPGSTVFLNSVATAPPGVYLNKNSDTKPSSTSDGAFAASGQVNAGETGGAGGLSSDCIGDISFSGGTGGNGGVGTASGGGGGAAGPNGAGKNGGNGDATAAGDDGGGGGGGANGGSSTAGSNGTTAGGAGGQGPAGTGGGTGGNGTAGGTGSNGGGGGGGDQAQPGGAGGDSTDLATINFQPIMVSGVSLSLDQIVGSGGGGGGSGNGSTTGGNGGTFGGGAGAEAAGSVGLVLITYEPRLDTGNMFMLF